MQDQNRRNNRRDPVGDMGAGVGQQAHVLVSLHSLNEEDKIKNGHTTGEVGGTNDLGDDAPEANEQLPT